MELRAALLAVVNYNDISVVQKKKHNPQHHCTLPALLGIGPMCVKSIILRDRHQRSRAVHSRTSLTIYIIIE